MKRLTAAILGLVFGMMMFSAGVICGEKIQAQKQFAPPSGYHWNAVTGRYEHDTKK